MITSRSRLFCTCRPVVGLTCPAWCASVRQRGGGDVRDTKGGMVRFRPHRPPRNDRYPDRAEPLQLYHNPSARDTKTRPDQIKENARSPQECIDTWERGGEKQGGGAFRSFVRPLSCPLPPLYIYPPRASQTFFTVRSIHPSRS